MVDKPKKKKEAFDSELSKNTWKIIRLDIWGTCDSDEGRRAE